MSTLPLVSVVIPAFNAGPFLGQAIESVFAQSHAPLEIIVVNDGSTDDTAVVLAGYGSRIRVVHQANAGLASARNAGLALARGEFVAWFDADDRCHRERLEYQVAYLSRHPQMVLCSSNFTAFNAERRFEEPYLAAYYRRVSRVPNGLADLYPTAALLEWDTSTGRKSIATRRGAVFESLVFGNFVHPPTVMCRRQLLEVNGELREDLRNLCDYEWLLRASRHGEFGFIERALIDYRLSPGQMSSDANTLIIKSELIDVLDIVEQLAPEFSRRHAAALKRRRGQAHLGVANALADLQEPGAWSAIYAGVKNHGRLPTAILLALKLLMPRPLLRLRRSMRARQTGPA